MWNVEGWEVGGGRWYVDGECSRITWPGVPLPIGRVADSSSGHQTLAFGRQLFPSHYDMGGEREREKLLGLE